MTKYERLKNSLEEKGVGKMKCFGNSMTPILKSGSLMYFIRQTTYEKGDIVFSKVRGRWIDCHKITKVHPDRGYMISNNKGHENGWTKNVFGKAVLAVHEKEVKEL